MDASCAWNGRDVVVTGVMRNLGSSTADFNVSPRYWLAGLGERKIVADDVRVPAGEVRAWTATNPYTARRYVGVRIRRCAPSVRTVPRAGGEENSPSGGD